MRRAKDPPAMPPEALASFEEFYRATVKQTLRSANRLARDTHLAEDATQEAYSRMLKIWPQRQTCEPDANRRYVGTTVRHILVDRYRWAAKLTGSEELEHIALDDVGYELVTDEMTNVTTAVRAFLDRQPIARRMVAVMFFLEERGYDEIAEIMGLAASTVRNHVLRIRQQFKPLRDRFDQMYGGGEQ